jgi:hypothetical protein
MGQDYVDGDQRVKGQLNCGTLAMQTASINDAMVTANAAVDAAKLKHQHAVKYSQDAGADVVTKTQDVHIVRGATGKAIGVNVAASTAPTGGDKKFTVDVQKGNQATGFATILTAVVTIDNTVANRQVVSGGLVASPTLAVGDTLRVIVTASGTTGSQGQGLNVTVTTREDAD